jgi:hypothetical protein
MLSMIFSNATAHGFPFRGWRILLTHLSKVYPTTEKKTTPTKNITGWTNNVV